MRSQGTLARPFTRDGVGLHSGVVARVEVLPAPPDHGRVFLRADLSSPTPIPARAEAVVDTFLATTLGVGDQRISTVEHLLAALHVAGVDNALIRVWGPEVPVLDGSALPWWVAILDAGVATQAVPMRPRVVKAPVRVAEGERRAALLPGVGFSVRVEVDFDHPLLRNRHLEVVVEPETFGRDLAPARTFAFAHEVEALHRSGRGRGGTLDNTLVLAADGVINPGGMRFLDEPVRHKVLDVVGDLALLGAPLEGRVDALRPGHRLHVALVRAFQAEHDARAAS